jgi:AcrR family transcriptional regulator
MSTPGRIPRPTREQTRERILDASLDVFIQRGVAAASIDEISEAAGFSRGAFYSNFADKEALVLALLQRFTDASAADLEALSKKHVDPDDYVNAVQARLRSPDRWNGRYDPALSAELTLFALRNPEAHPVLRERFHRGQQATLRAVEETATARGLRPAPNRSTIASMLAATEFGFDVFALIDPDFDATRAYDEVLAFLSEAGAAIAEKEARLP